MFKKFKLFWLNSKFYSVLIYTLICECPTELYFDLFRSKSQCFRMRFRVLRSVTIYPFYLFPVQLQWGWWLKVKFGFQIRRFTYSYSYHVFSQFFVSLIWTIPTAEQQLRPYSIILFHLHLEVFFYFSRSPQVSKFHGYSLHWRLKLNGNTYKKNIANFIFCKRSKFYSTSVFWIRWYH